jgi:hypothetical protein
MRVYVAGPMSGIKDHNFPAFHATAAALRAAGYDVVNPAEQEYNNDLTRPWDFYMRRDIPLLCTCDAIYMLQGWGASKGATLEYVIATRLGMETMYEEEMLWI